jgi:DNA anti-recombination protein RmuC
MRDDDADGFAPRDAERGTVTLGETASRIGVSGLDPAEAGNLDQIRDILFGVQSRELDKRIFRLEDRLARDTADLRDDIKRRFDALELYARTELEALADRLKAEAGERANAIDDVVRAISDTTRSLERQSAHVDEQSSKGQRDLREQILDRSKSLAEDIRRTSESLSAALERRFDTLEQQKADRTAVAALLSEMAMRLTSDLKFPTGK